jgi:hypothetical protein
MFTHRRRILIPLPVTIKLAPAALDVIEQVVNLSLDNRGKVRSGCSGKERCRPEKQE